MYKPKLLAALKELTSPNYNLNAQEQEVLADFNKDAAEYSITPTTLRYREVNKLEDKLFVKNMHIRIGVMLSVLVLINSVAA